MQGESTHVVGFDRRRPNLRLKLTARAPTLGCGRLGRRSLGAPR